MYVANGLKAATTYKFELFASTAIGDGPIQEATMESGVPPGENNCILSQCRFDWCSRKIYSF
jgi:hypothetical protein